MSKYRDKTIVTLGPVGTDAESVVRTLTSHIILEESFEKSMKSAIDNDYLALVCCGYKSEKDDKSWVDLNFKYNGKLKIIDIILRSTKTMALVKNVHSTSIKNIVIHPSTEELLHNHYCLDKHRNTTIHKVNNKPTAVELVDLGKYDLTIGSLDVIKNYKNMEILKPIDAQMIWALYERV